MKNERRISDSCDKDNSVDKLIISSVDKLIVSNSLKLLILMTLVMTSTKPRNRKGRRYLAKHYESKQTLNTVQKV